MFRFEKELSVRDRRTLGCAVSFLNGIIFVFSIFMLSGSIFILVELPIRSRVLNYDSNIIVQAMTLLAILLLVLHGVGIKIWLDISQCWSRQRCLFIANVWILFLVISSLFTLVMGFLTLSQETRVHHIIKENLKTAMNKYSSSGPAKVIVDSIQIRFECCGGNSFNDWLQISWVDLAYVQQTKAKNDPRNAESSRYYTNSVPYSCCNPKDQLPCISDEITSSSAHRHQGNRLSIYTRGCHEAIGEYLFPIFTTSGIGLILTWIIQMLIILHARYLYTSAVALERAGSDGLSMGYFVDTDQLARILKFKVPEREMKSPSKKKVTSSKLLVPNGVDIHRERSGCAACILNSKNYKDNQDLSADVSLTFADTSSYKANHSCKTTKKIHSLKKTRHAVKVAINENLNPAHVKKSSSISEGLLQTSRRQAMSDYHHTCHSCVEIRAQQDVMGNIDTDETDSVENVPQGNFHGDTTNCLHFRGPKQGTRHDGNIECSKSLSSGDLSQSQQKLENNAGNEKREHLEERDHNGGRELQPMANLSNEVSTKITNSHTKKNARETFSTNLSDLHTESIRRHMLGVNQYPGALQSGSILHGKQTKAQPVQEFCEHSTQTVFLDPSKVWRETCTQSEKYVKTAILRDKKETKQHKGSSELVLQCAKYPNRNCVQENSFQCNAKTLPIQERPSTKEQELRLKSTQHECQCNDPVGCLSQESHEVWRITQSISSKSQNSVGSYAAANVTQPGTKSCSQELDLHDQYTCADGVNTRKAFLPGKHHHSSGDSYETAGTPPISTATNQCASRTDKIEELYAQVNLNQKINVSGSASGNGQIEHLTYRTNFDTQSRRPNFNDQRVNKPNSYNTDSFHEQVTAKNVLILSDKSEMNSEEVVIEPDRNHCVGKHHGTELGLHERGFNITEKGDNEVRKRSIDSHDYYKAKPKPDENTHNDNEELHHRRCKGVYHEYAPLPSKAVNYHISDENADFEESAPDHSMLLSPNYTQAAANMNSSTVASRKKRLTAGSEMPIDKSPFSSNGPNETSKVDKESTMSGQICGLIDKCDPKQRNAGSLRPLQCRK